MQADKFGLGLLIIVLLGGLHACARQTYRPDPLAETRWKVYRQVLSRVEHWRLTGSIAVNSADQGWDARINWQQSQDGGYQLRFSAPLGQGAMLLRGAPNQVTLRTAEGETYSAQDPESLLYQVTRVSVPLQSLYFWIRGLPVPNVEQTEYRLTAEGRLNSLQQLGWSIEYSNYRDVNGLSLPSKLLLQHPDWRVKLAVSEWTLTAE